MRVENFQAFQKQAQAPGDGSQLPRDWRREGNAMKFILAVGEQTKDLRRANAMGLCVHWIEPEIIGKDQTAWLQCPQHLSTYFAANLRIQYGGQSCKLHDQVEGLRGTRQGLSICICKIESRMPVMCLR